MSSNEISRETIIKKMAELLRAGATLLAETCPLCGSPLLKLRSGEVVCPVHGRIFVAKTEEEVAEASVLGVLTDLEKTISTTLSRIAKRLREDISSEEIPRVLVYLLDALERIERIKTYLKKESASEKK